MKTLENGFVPDFHPTHLEVLEMLEGPSMMETKPDPLLNAPWDKIAMKIGYDKCKLLYFNFCCC